MGGRRCRVDDQAYRELLNLLMVSDPTPCPVAMLKAWADQEAVRRGFDGGWVEAYHSHIGRAAHMDEMAERIAKAFHEAYEAAAPAFGYKTREASAVPWDQVPAANRGLMVATVRRLLEANVIAAGVRGGL